MHTTATVAVDAATDVDVRTYTHDDGTHVVWVEVGIPGHALAVHGSADDDERIAAAFLASANAKREAS